MRRMSFGGVVLAAAAILTQGMIAEEAAAGITRTINFQAQLTDSVSGNPVADGFYGITFRIYDVASGGTHLWEEPHANVSVQDGIFSVVLGSVAALGLAFDEPYWLSVNVEGDGEMSPRFALAAAPYALMAADSEKLGGVDAAQYAISATLSNAAGVINTPTNPLDWSQLKNVPGDFADGSDDGNTYTAGTGLTLTGTDFAVVFGAAATEVAEGNHDHTHVGDVTGTVGATTVSAIQGQAVDVTTPGPTDGQVLKWNNLASQWEPADDAGGAGSGQVDTISPGTGISVNAADPVNPEVSLDQTVTDAAYVNVSGDTMAGNLDMATLYKVTNLAAPSADPDAATKKYVDDSVAAAGGGDITGVTAGLGLTGGGAGPGNLTLDVGAGTGISVAADVVSLDQTVTDGLYVELDGTGTMSGALRINDLGGTVAVISETGISKNAGTPQTFSIQNLSGGGMTLQVNTDTVWHEGNDGPGSLLNADLLDGMNSLDFVAVAGDQMAGNLDMNSANKVINLAAPSADTDAATKGYVDTVIGGKADAAHDHDADYVNVGGDTMTGQLLVDLAADGKGIVTRGSATQSQNLQEWQNVSSTVLASVSSTGDIDTTGAVSAGTTISAGGDITSTAGVFTGDGSGLTNINQGSHVHVLDDLGDVMATGEGTGGGLDADTVDAYHANELGRLAANQEFTGWNLFSGRVGIQNAPAMPNHALQLVSDGFLQAARLESSNAVPNSEVLHVEYTGAEGTANAVYAVQGSGANALYADGNVTATGAFTGDGSGLTNIDPASHDHPATDITSGILDDARLSANIPRLDAAAQTFAGNQTFSTNGRFLGRLGVGNVAMPPANAFEVVSQGHLVAASIESDYDVGTPEVLHVEYTGTNPAADAVYAVQGAGANALYADGNVTATGNVTSTGGVFTGNGSGLTNIDQGSHTHVLNDLGDVTATGEGDGGGLDADTVDGEHATAFADAVHQHSATDITTDTLDDARLSSNVPLLDSLTNVFARVGAGTLAAPNHPLHVASDTFLQAANISSGFSNFSPEVLHVEYTGTSGAANTIYAVQGNGLNALYADGNIQATGNLLVTGNITSSTGVIFGNGSGLTSLNAANLTGTVSDARFSAYDDLGAESRLNNDDGADLLTRDQADARYVEVAGDTMTGQLLVDLAADDVALITRGAPAGFADLQQWQDGASTVLAGVDSTGDIYTAGSVTADAGVSVTGDIAVSGLVDGVDVAALDTSAVKTTGDQTVGGVKTFTAIPAFNGGDGPGGTAPFTVDSDIWVSLLNADMVDGLHAGDLSLAGHTHTLAEGATDVTATAANLNLLTGLTGTVWTSDNDGATTGLSADNLDGLDSLAFLRSDVDDSYAGTTLTIGGSSTLDVDGTLQIDGGMIKATTGLVANLNADLLDDEHGAFYRDATNINAGTLSPNWYSAYTDLGAEGILDNNAVGDLLTQQQLDARFVNVTDTAGGGDVSGTFSALVVANDSHTHSSATISEADPQVGTITANYVPRWNGTELVTGRIQDNGSTVGIGGLSSNTQFYLYDNRGAVDSLPHYGFYTDVRANDNSNDSAYTTNYGYYAYSRGDPTISGAWNSNYGSYGYARGSAVAGSIARNYGSFGYAYGTGGSENYGVFGQASGTTSTNYGVFGSASGGTTNWAGYFSGNVNVTGTVGAADPTSLNHATTLGYENDRRPGVEYSHLQSTGVTITATTVPYTNVRSLTLTAPEAGYVILMATGYYIMDHSTARATYHFVYLSSTSGGGDLDYNRVEIPMTVGTATVASFRLPISLSAVEQVAAGSYSYWLTGRKGSADPNPQIYNPKLTAIFVPNRY